MKDAIVPCLNIQWTDEEEGKWEKQRETRAYFNMWRVQTVKSSDEHKHMIQKDSLKMKNRQNRHALS